MVFPYSKKINEELIYSTYTSIYVYEHTFPFWLIVIDTVILRMQNGKEIESKRKSISVFGCSVERFSFWRCTPSDPVDRARKKNVMISKLFYCFWKINTAFVNSFSHVRTLTTSLCPVKSYASDNFWQDYKLKSSSSFTQNGCPLYPRYNSSGQGC